MQTTTSPQSASRTSTNRNAAFTFVEVMFATIILGIGLIMVAALLPVGMRQTTDTADRVTGRAIAENGFFTIQAVVNEDLFFSSGGSAEGYYPIGLPVTEPVPPGPNPANSILLGESIAVASMVVDASDLNNYFHPFSVQGGALNTNNAAALATYIATDPDESLLGFPEGPTNAIARTFGNRVITSDPRYAWVAFYQRSLTVGLNNAIPPARAVTPSDTATVTVMALKNPTGSQFGPKELWDWRNGPHLVQTRTTRGGVDVNGVLRPSTIRIFASDIDSANNVAGIDNPNDETISSDNWSEIKVLAAAKGAFVVIANDFIEDDDTMNPRQFGDLEGVVLRLGNQIATGTEFGDDYVEFEIDPTFELPAVGVPGETLPETDADRRPIAWLVGRQAIIDEATDDFQGFDGGPMPVGFFQARMPLP